MKEASMKLGPAKLAVHPTPHRWWGREEEAGLEFMALPTGLPSSAVLPQYTTPSEPSGNIQSETDKSNDSSNAHVESRVETNTPIQTVRNAHQNCTKDTGILGAGSEFEP